MLKICSPGGNANHKYIEIPSHLSHNDYYQENKKQIVVRMWKKRNHYTLLVQMEIEQLFKNTMWVPPTKTTRNTTTMTQLYHS
jgi:hypothetical protein